MTTTYETRLYFNDEIPRIRCGERSCIIHEGYKWVTFTEKHNPKRKGKLPITSERCQELLARVR